MRGSAAFRVAVAPGGALAGPWVQNPLWTAARAVPSLDLRFADNKTLGDAVGGGSLVTFTRASTGTFVDGSRVLQTAATDAPRFDHNPTTGESLGLLVEEARTNSIRNNTGVGAVAGTPGTLPTNWITTGSGLGTLTQQIVGTGTQNGINYIDIRISGTTSTANVAYSFDGLTAVAATNGQSWTTSSYLSIVGGSTSNLTVGLRLVERTAVGVAITNSNNDVTSSLSSTLIRSTLLRTLNQATTAFVSTDVLFGFASGVAIDITLRIGLPQLEQGAFATSAIPTTTATVTRAADVASITGSNFGFYNQTEGTVYGEGSTFNTGASSCLVSIDDTTSSNRIQLRRSTSASTLRMVSSGGSIDANLTTGTALGVNKIATGVSASNQNLVSNGVIATGITSITPMPTVTQAQIGNGSASTAFSGTIKRLTYWPVRLANTTLQQITQP